MNFFNVIKKKPKIGLVLGGGGARGFAHIGVIKAFAEQGITFDFVAGTSAGSIVGALYAYGMSPAEMQEKAKEINVKDIRTNKIPFMPSKADGIANVLIKNIGDIEFSDLNIPFCAVAVDIKSSSEVHLTKGNLAKSVAASCSVPGIFYPVEIDNYVLFDGGLLNNIPSNVPKLFGCDIVIAVDVNSKRGQGTESTKYLDQVASSIAIMMKSNSLKGYLNADVMIQPDIRRFKSTQLSNIDDMVLEGYNATMFQMHKIKELIGYKTSGDKQKIYNNKINRKNKLII